MLFFGALGSYVQSLAKRTMGLDSAIWREDLTDYTW